MDRPLFNKSIQELKAAFSKKFADRVFLETLRDELARRSTDESIQLKARVYELLAKHPTKQTINSTEEPVNTPISPLAKPSASKDPFKPSVQSFSLTEEEKETVRKKVESEKRQSLFNDPIDILRTWTVLEVLAPQAYSPPESRLIASLEGSFFPWEGKGEKSRPDQRLYYEIIVGTIELGKAMTALLDIYADKRIERPSVKGKGVLATIIVDNTGKLCGEFPIAVSSFGWGVPKALRGDLGSLSKWADAEEELVKSIERILRRRNEGSNNELSIDRPALLAAYAHIVDTLELPHDWVNPPSVAIRIYQGAKNPDLPEPSLLNSFFLNDLATAKELFRSGKASRNLRLYLGADKPDHRLDLLNDTCALETAVAPTMIPPARWPGPERHSLVLLQQAAVNLAISELKDTGILAVNGPPGTGKTTLLRDILASIVTQRAEAMCEFGNPSDAFTETEQKLHIGSAWLHFYKLSPKLKGYEVLIASSNNKAVENVSAELPGLNTIAADAKDLRYFAPLATELLEKESWGLISSVLGNASNRSKFRQKFWWDNEIGLFTYLSEASGIPQILEIKDQETGKIIEERRPRIVAECDAPEGLPQALKRWEDARKEFLEALKDSKKALEKLELIKKELARLSSFAVKEQSALSDLQAAHTHQKNIHILLKKAEKSCMAQESKLQYAQKAQNKHYALKPGFFARFFQRPSYVTWKEEWNHLSQEAILCGSRREQCLESLLQLKTQQQKAISQVKKKDKRHIAATKAYTEARSSTDKIKAELSQHLIDEGFFIQSHAHKHNTMPWCDKATQILRDNVFIAAMRLHKAFIDASAKPLRHNLGLFMYVLSGRSFSDIEKQNLIGDLWASFFLVVPSVSTTFASVERMIKKLPPESLGWLLIDEAGQALPQAAVGAIMRTKRAVVVGDPIQIEPIVTLPNTLTENICRHFGVDPDRYNAPESSVQTIADVATPYYGRFGLRSVGVPLLVHRRCADPMFSISNKIAYKRLMIQAKRSGLSKIRDCLGMSFWFDVNGQSEEKWCPQEGHKVLELLKKLKQKDISPDLYIITPFAVVQDNMRRLIRENGILQGWVEDPYRWTTERVGTVHTVQGREAEAVIFVLGAPSTTQNGARSWAGNRPNLLNVALTRAKEVIYVVGNRQLWQNAGLFTELAARVN